MAGIGSRGWWGPRSWRDDGREIFYQTPPPGGKVMSVPVTAQGEHARTGKCPRAVQPPKSNVFWKHPRRPTIPGVPPTRSHPHRCPLRRRRELDEPAGEEVSHDHRSWNAAWTVQRCCRDRQRRDGRGLSGDAVSGSVATWPSKSCRPRSRPTPIAWRRFEQEARAAAALNHSNILGRCCIRFEAVFFLHRH